VGDKHRVLLGTLAPDSDLGNQEWSPNGEYHLSCNLKDARTMKCAPGKENVDVKRLREGGSFKEQKFVWVE
jgi:hypothetical protein